MKIHIVDKDDTIIGYKERDSLTPQDIYRVSALWLRNSKGEVLMARRSLLKVKNPGLWTGAAAGTVEEGETYDSNIVKEINEELGFSLSITDLYKGPKLFIDNKESGSFFDQWYFYTLDTPTYDFVLQKNEVAEVRWMSPGALTEWCTKHPEEFTSNFPKWFRTILDYKTE